MRILVVSGEYPPQVGGVADYSALLVDALRARGQEVRVLTGAALGPEEPRAEVWRWVRSWSVESWPIVTAALAEWRADVVHLQYQSGAFQLSGAVNLLPCWLRLRRSVARTVVTFHDLRVPYLFPKAGPLRPLAVRALLRGSHAAIFVDSADLAKVGSAPRRHWIPIGSNIPRAPGGDFDRSALRERLGCGQGEPLIGFFGFLSAGKGALTLLRALARLRDSGTPARLVLIGAGANSGIASDNDDERSALALVDQLGLAPLVTTTGYLAPADVSAHLLACDVVALPYSDGASFRRGSLLAALEHGCAVVTTPPRGSAAGFDDRRLEPGRQFLVVEPDDPAALAAAMLRLVADSRLRGCLGAQGRSLAARCSWETVASQTLSVYEEVITPVRPAARPRAR